MLRIKKIRESFLDWCMWTVLLAVYLLAVPGNM